MYKIRNKQKKRMFNKIMHSFFMLFAAKRKIFPHTSLVHFGSSFLVQLIDSPKKKTISE